MPGMEKETPPGAWAAAGGCTALAMLALWAAAGAGSTGDTPP